MICHLRTTAIAFCLLATLACQHFGQNEPDGNESGGPASSEAAATIDGRTITVGELDHHIKEDLFNDATSGGNVANVYQVRSRALNEMLDEMAIEKAAAAANLSPEEYLSQQIDAQGEIPEEEIVAFFDKQKDRMSEDVTLDLVRDQINDYLRGQRAPAIISGLREQADAEVLLEPARVDVEAIGPSRGPDDAVVTIIEFSDFQCPYCARVVPTIDQILDKYPTQVRFVFRNLPLNQIHPRAQAAAEAAACAANQGDFWDYHDLIFANNKAVSDEDLEGHASELGLDMQAFRQCVQNRETQQLVEADIAAGKSLRISGTPSFVINGLPLPGARGIEEYTKDIDEEIARISADGSYATR
jgi:protein-disulfide isomerase